MPKLQTKKRWLVFLLLVIGIVSVPLFYLNCSGSPTGSADSASVLNTVDNGGIIAYQLQIDTLAYMSCGDLTSGAYDPTTFWNFKVGAYNSSSGNCANGGSGSGVCLNTAFTYAVRNLDLATKESILSTSTINQNLYPDLSVRYASDLVDSSSIISWNGTSGSSSYADSNLLGTSILSNFASQLYSGTENDWHNSNFPSGETIPMSGLVSYPGLGSSPDAVESALRTAVTQSSGNAFLTTELAQAGTETGASYQNSYSSAYGYGYRFTFGYGPLQNSGPERAITSNGVTEYNLQTGSPTGSQWSCQSYIIVYPGDVGRTGVPTCNATTNPTPSNALQTALVEMLPNWQIDFNGRCVLPPSTVTSGEFCEGNLQMNAPGAYTPSTTVYTGGCTAAANNCPHVVSVCARQ